MARFPKNLRVNVTEEDIELAECRVPTKCMHKRAITRAIKAYAGDDADVRVKVDGSGITVKRRKDYRERAFLPAPAIKTMLAFDRKAVVKPHSYTIKLVKTTRIKKTTEEERAKNREAVAACKARQIADGTYVKRERKLRSVGLQG